ncbi:MAG TPA: LysM domain-containing protein [Opitutaceae bacterium]|nr:LysM domain-containing protein [Opitutaceae bacterium]
MDTISRDSNTSYAPIAAVIVGLLALVLSIVGLVKISAINKKLGPVDVADLSARVETVQNDARGAVSTADAARSSVTTLATQTQRAFDTVTAELGNLRTSVNKIEMGAPKASSGSSSSAAAASATAEPGTYVVKSGDTGVKIARDNNVSLTALMAANPDVNWNRLSVGQKISIPGGR